MSIKSNVNIIVLNKQYSRYEDWSGTSYSLTAGSWMTLFFKSIASNKIVKDVSIVVKVTGASSSFVGKAQLLIDGVAHMTVVLRGNVTDIRSLMYNNAGFDRIDTVEVRILTDTTQTYYIDYNIYISTVQ